jgi:hypothetical protein
MTARHVCRLRISGSRVRRRLMRARRYFVGAALVSVFVAGAAGVVLALELESEPLELDDSLVLLVVVSLVEPEVEPPVAPVAVLAEVPEAAVLPEVALSVL